MSADNGIYIVRFPDGYRVADCQAIENIDYYPRNSRERKNVLKDYFGKSKLFHTKHQAFERAFDMAVGNITEYGIVFLGEYESFSAKCNCRTKEELLAQLGINAKRLEMMVGKLTRREGAVIIGRYGLCNFSPYTLESLGRIFKVTRERIRQIESVALDKLKAMSR